MGRSLRTAISLACGMSVLSNGSAGADSRISILAVAKARNRVRRFGIHAGDSRASNGERQTATLDGDPRTLSDVAFSAKSTGLISPRSRPDHKAMTRQMLFDFFTESISLFLGADRQVSISPYSAEGHEDSAAPCLVVRNQYFLATSHIGENDIRARFPSR
jgi:hypothetical protein